MFHRFSVVPPKARSQIKGARSAPAATTNATPNNNCGADCDGSIVPQLTKRQKTARACDRCRLHRTKCDEQKPCTQCVGTKARCVVSYGSPGSSQPNNGNNDTNYTRSKAYPDLDHGSRGCHNVRSRIEAGTSAGTDHSIASSSPVTDPSFSSSGKSMSQHSSWTTRTPPNNMLKEWFDLPTPIQSFFTTDRSALPYGSAFGDSLFPQLPYPVLPSDGHPLAPITLSKSQRSYYLRFFWDECHPLMPVMSEAEFAELDAMPPPTLFDEYSTRSSLIDCMIALGIQHSHATGLSGRILGPLKPLSWQSRHATPSPEASWPGFEHFNRCRECMRTNTEVGLEGLKCHILMTLYLMKGSAFCDAYNLLGITVRKAYIAKLHRQPPSHLLETEKTARMQLWSILFSLDVQCSLQLDMPTAIQKNLVKCPLPTKNALARYISCSSLCTSSASSYAYSTSLASLAVVVIDASACVPMTDLDDDSDDDHSPVVLEHQALNLSSALQNLEVWRNQLPSELLLAQCADDSNITEVRDLDRNLTLPHWLQRQAVFLELQYHNAYTLIQRPFINRYRSHVDNTIGGNATQPDAQQPHVKLHAASAFHHATMIIDTVYNVCSSSDILYGWSEVLQPLWNATMTIVTYTYSKANSLNSTIQKALGSLSRAQAVFETFSSTCPSANSAKGTIHSLVNSLQNTAAQTSSMLPISESMSWDLFASLLEQPQTNSVGLETSPTSTVFTSNAIFPPFTPSSSHINSCDFDPASIQFDDC